MSAAVTTPQAGADARVDVATVTGRAHKQLTSRKASFAALIIAVLWTIPTFGLLLTSFRPEQSIRRSGWWTWFTNPELTLENYTETLFGGASFSTFFINSVAITIPSVVIPVTLACLAAYAFAWMNFPFRHTLFVAVFALQIVPLQVALIPQLQIYVGMGINGTFWPLWLSHTVFALPLAVFLLHNFMREVPGELIEAARVDGAGHVTIFMRIMAPLIIPAIAAFSIFQFLWIWNDLLMALVYAQRNDIQPMTVAVTRLLGTYASEWSLLAAAAFLIMVVPLIVFIALQRFFVQGLLAGSVK